MAAAGAPWYMPLLWPFGHVYNVLNGKSISTERPALSDGGLDIWGHLTSFAAAARNFGLAYACVYYVNAPYPAFGRAAVYEMSWMLPIIARNIAGAWLIAGTWDWLLYFSPLTTRLQPFKFNPKRPSTQQLLHDAFWTTTAVVSAAAIEIWLCHMWASGAIAFQHSLMDTPVQNMLWILFVTHWRIPHFHLMHRAMHPWKTTRVPDVGVFLYKHVHALHHKSYNPTAFSGTSMHPVESTLYFSSCLLAVPFGVHPTIVLTCIADCALGAWLGHDGFKWPGSGDYFHYLHHAHFDCNYGAMHVPLDKWLGTYAGCKQDVRKIWA